MGCDAITDDEISLLKEIAKCKKLLNAANLFHTISSLFKHADNKDELLRLNKTVILDTIEKVQPILGTKRILKSNVLSHSKMYYWIEKKKCQHSIFSIVSTQTSQSTTSCRSGYR